MVTYSTLCAFLLLLANLNFFLPSSVYQYIYSTDVRSLLLIFSTGIIIIMYLLQNKIFAWKSYKECLFGKHIYLFWFLVAVEILYSSITYQKSITSFGKLTYFYLALAGYFVLSYFIKNKDDLRTVKRMIVAISFVMRLNDMVNSVLFSRNGYSSFYLDILAVPLALAGALDKEEEHRCFYLIATIILIIDYYIFSDNSAIKMIIGCVFLAEIIIKIYSNANREDAAIMTPIVILALGFAAYGTFDWLREMIGSDVGVKVRTYAIEYYIQQIMEHPILGMGFIDSKWGDEYERLLMGGLNLAGGYNQYYLDDVGVFGFAQQFGIVGCIWLFSLLKRCVKTIWLLLERFKMENVGLIAAILAMFVSLMPLGKAPIGIFPFILVFVEKNFEMEQIEPDDIME